MRRCSTTASRACPTSPCRAILNIVDALPVTESGKVTKYKLRERGITAATWDRDKAGYKVARRIPS